MDSWEVGLCTEKSQPAVLSLSSAPAPSTEGTLAVCCPHVLSLILTDLTTTRGGSKITGPCLEVSSSL